MHQKKIAILHYSAPPVVGGVESVVLAQAGGLVKLGYAVLVAAGEGQQSALPAGVEFFHLPEMSTRHPQTLRLSQALEAGRVPAGFEAAADRLEEALKPVLSQADVILAHNLFSKHFNLPLTAALVRLLDRKELPPCIAWCHDFTWSSPHSRHLVHAGYPWELLRTARSDLIYVTVSRARQQELAELFSCPPERIRVIYDGLHPEVLLGISPAGQDLIERLRLYESDLNLLLPVRVTQAKNIELGIQVVAALKAQGLSPRLVVTGPPDPHDPQGLEYFHGLLDLCEQAGVSQEVRFVYRSGADPEQPCILDMPVVGDLFRLSDALFMPSHREGFGMPIPEAGLAGLPVFASERIPAAGEIGGADIFSFSPEAQPAQVAEMILDWARKDPVHRLRRRARQRFTWQSILRDELLPLLEEAA